jgi:glycosyltransferase involved in cell wall biosynthesis
MASEASGPTYSVLRLSQCLTEQGVRSDVFSTGTHAPEGVRHFAVNFARAPIFGRLVASRALKTEVLREAASGSLLHTHGLWLLPNIYPALAARRFEVPFAVSPRGMLASAALEFSKVPKRLFWHAIQHSALKRVTFFHATSAEEIEDIRRAGLRAPVALIPNGIDLPATTPLPDSSDPFTVLHLGRLHPKKGTDRLVAAWSRLEDQFPEWRLRIVGPSEIGYAEALAAQIARAGLKRVVIEGPLFGDAKLKAYSSAELFVLPTLNENFGLVVAEALANGTPVISTKGAPWMGLRAERCGWWIDHGVDALELTLRTAMSLTRADRAAMGARGRCWMKRDFAWEGIALQMATVYRWALQGGTVPSCVHVD